MPTSFPLSSDLGVLTNGTDQTSTLNSILSNSAYLGLILDFPAGGAVTINGTVNANGKTLLFRQGSYFTGSGALTNLIISAGFHQKCFDTSITISNAGLANEKFSAMWFGALSGSGNSQPAIQKTIDTVIANPLMKTVFIPAGTYYIDSPLIVYNWNGTVYAQCCISIEGESSFWQASTGGTTIRTNGFLDTFALGIENGKGVEIKKIKFLGGFTPPYTNGYNFFTCSFSSFTDGVSRDSVNSPYSGIVIDPFSSTMPGDGGYPGLNSGGSTNFYRGTGSGGSTGTVIEDCFISNFVIGIITSPSGLTSNAELTSIIKTQFFACKACVVGCQDQEKTNRIDFAAVWGQTHTFFYSGVSGGYGAVTPGNWLISNVNVAGALNTFIQRHGTGYFPLYVKNIYAESLGTVGEWTESQGGSLEDSLFDFVDLSTFAAYPSNYHFKGSGVTVKNCSFRYYGNNNRMILSGNVFDRCSFNEVPFIVNNGYLKDCYIYYGGNSIVNPGTDILDQKQNFHFYFASGRYSFVDTNQLGQGKRIGINMSYNPNPVNIIWADGLNFSLSTVSISANVATVTPPTTADLNRVTIGGLIYNGTTGYVLGVVSAIGATTYTVSYVPNGISSGNYLLGQIYTLYGLTFMGSITNGSDQITNVVQDFGSIQGVINAGGFVSIQGFYGFRSYGQEARMLSYNSSTGVITMDRPASETASNIYFANNFTQKFIQQMGDGSGSGSEIYSNEIFPKGSEWADNNPINGGMRRFIINTTGYFAQAPNAVWVQIS